MPDSRAVCGMMLSAVPALNWQIETTADFQRVDVAGHDRLQLVDDLRADQDAVDRLVRLGGVRAAALDVDIDAVGRRHHRTGPDGEFAERDAGEVVHPVDLLDAEPLHHAVLDHLAAAAAALLGRLEDHHGGAGEIARLGQVARGAQEHRGVAVVAAGVHLARHGRLVRQVVRLDDRQGVHVGAQPDHLAAVALGAADDADHAGAADAGHHLVAAEGAQLVGDRRGGAVDVELQFGMGVQVVPPGGDLVMQVGNAVDDRHQDSPRTPSIAKIGPMDPIAQAKHAPERPSGY